MSLPASVTSSTLHSRQSSYQSSPALGPKNSETPPPEMQLTSPTDQRIQSAVRERDYPCGPWLNVPRPDPACKTITHTYGGLGGFTQDTYTYCREDRQGKCADVAQQCLQKQ